MLISRRASRARGFLAIVMLAIAMLALGCSSNDQTTKAPPKQASPPAAKLAAAPPPAPPPAPPAPPRDPEDYYFDRSLQADDLASRTLRELALMRNTLYARKGQPFRKKWLHDFFSAKPWYQPGALVGSDALDALDRQNAHLIAQAETTMSAEELMRRFDALNARREQEKALPHDDIERRLLAMRLGIPLGADEDEVLSPMEDPKLLDAQITVEQLNDLSRRDLRMLRNMVYARRGRPFRSALLTQYFDAASWYRVDQSYTEAKLSALDRRNIRLIRSVEDSLGGPLSDHDHMAEEGWLDEA